jgi:hypothetical protein
MVPTLPGMIRFVRPSQFINAFSPIDVRLLGSIRLVRLVQDSNAWSAIEFRLLGS